MYCVQVHTTNKKTFLDVNKYNVTLSKKTVMNESALFQECKAMSQSVFQAVCTYWHHTVYENAVASKTLKDILPEMVKILATNIEALHKISENINISRNIQPKTARISVEHLESKFPAEILFTCKKGFLMVFKE